MEHLYHYTYYAYGYWNEIQDERTKGYPLVAVHPITMAGIMGAYFLAVTKIGPSWMKDRPAFQLRQLMFAYNITMVFVNAFFLFESVRRCDYGRRLLDFKYPDRSDVSSETLKVKSAPCLLTVIIICALSFSHFCLGVSMHDLNWPVASIAFHFASTPHDKPINQQC